MFADSPSTVEEIKYNASSYVKQVTPETLRKVGASFAIRVKVCLNCDGLLIEGVTLERLCLKK